MVNDVVMNCNLNRMNTRSLPMNLYVPSVTSQFKKKSFKYACAIAWNVVPSDFKDIYTYNNFKAKLKTLILHDLAHLIIFLCTKCFYILTLSIYIN